MAVTRDVAAGLRVGGEMVLRTPEIRFAGELGMRGLGMLLGTFELVEVMHWRERAPQRICDCPHEIPTVRRHSGPLV